MLKPASSEAGFIFKISAQEFGVSAVFCSRNQKPNMFIVCSSTYIPTLLPALMNGLYRTCTAILKKQLRLALFPLGCIHGM